MKHSIKRALPLLAALTAVAAPAQQYFKAHGVSVSVGATGNYLETLTTNPTPTTATVPSLSGGVINTTVSNQQQYITSSLGFLSSFQVHPVPWAGLEFNYGFQRYSERYNFNYASSAATQTVSVPVVTHEATAAYQFHPKHIPFQPFLNIGGGAIDFVPTFSGSNQWRWAGLLEPGFDIPLPPDKRLAIRIEGRGLFYRAPNFYNSALSARGWRVSAEPSASFVYRF